MRSTVVLALVLTGTCILRPVRASEREDALAIIDKAITAQGGEQALVKARNVMRKASGTMTVADTQVPFTTEVTLSLPDKMRLSIDLDKRVTVVTVVNGERGWQRSGGATADLGKESLGDVRDDLYLWWLASLVPLKKAEITLATVPEVQVNGKPAVGVKVSSKGQRDVKLYFDKTSGLLIKMATQARTGGTMMDREHSFSDYKDFDGVKLYTRSVEMLNGKKQRELQGVTHEFLRKVDESQFVKP
jgi:hypothetical protein